MYFWPLNIQRRKEVVGNRADLLRVFAEELGLKYKLKKNNLYLFGHHDIKIEFMSSNYHNEGEIELIASISIQPNGTDEYLHWYDLFHLTKALLKNRKVISFTINKGEDWKKSKLRKLTRKYYVPLFHTVTDSETSIEFMQGKAVKYKGTTFQLKSKYDSVLLRSSLRIAEKM